MFDPKLKEALGRVQKPGRYTGGEPGSVYKDKEKVDVRFAFCFPDTYEVGMSFLGEKILYELLNRRENWWCERAFMPWLDMKAEMERLGLPLYTMESKDPLTAFDAVGFTLQYELSYTNILAKMCIRDRSSLLTSVASKGCAPYKSVLCHGWVVDEQGKQMHKSAGNGVEPSEIIKDYGADIIRLWVASSDYTVDVRAGKNIFKQLSEAYRKIRNTARFILGNLDGFDPNTDCVADDQLQEIDRWALAALDDLIVSTNAGYAVYDFNKVYHAVYNFCVVAMSNFYLDVTKDRLYCTNGVARQAAQTAMYKILVTLDKIIAPILCFTSQEIWDFLPKTDGMNKYVVFEDMPKAGQYAADEAFKAKWAQLIAVRDEVKKVLEQARAEKTIGASLEAAVTLYCNDAVYDLLNSIPMDELADLMIVSHVELVKGEGGSASAVEGLGVAAAHAVGEKCERCWKYSDTIGSHSAHPTLCARCASVVEA